MAYYVSNVLNGTAGGGAITAVPTYHRPVSTAASAGVVLHDRATLSLASGTNFASNDVVEMWVLPAGFVLVDWVLWWSTWDSSTGLATKVGLMTGTPLDYTRALATVGVELMPTGSTVLRTAGAASPKAVVSGGVTATEMMLFNALGASTSDRSVGVGIETQASSNPSTTRKLVFDAFYKAAV